MTTKEPTPHIKVHDEDEFTPKARLLPTVASVWLVALLLSVFAATTVADQVQAWDRVRDVRGVAPLVEGLGALQETLGLHHLHEFLGAVRRQLNDRYVVAKALDEPVDVDVPIEVPTTETELAHQRAPSKRRVLVIGASSIQFALGVELERRFPTYENVKVMRFGQLATSLARPDFFDWLKKAQTLIEEFKPDLIVTNFGGNDAQDILMPDGTKVAYDSPAWDVTFQKLVTDLIELGRQNKADTVMIGMPVMREDKFTKKMERLNRAMEEATVRAGGLFVSAWALSSTAKGEYLTSVRFKGKRGLMRTSDGVHYSKLGAALIVEDVLRRIEARYAFVPSDPTLAPAEPHRFESKLLGRWVSYVVYRPRDLPENETTPLILLGPTANALAEEGTRHPHRSLQKFAQRERVTIALLEPFELTPAAGAEPSDALPARFLEEELLADLLRHFPSEGRVGLVASVSALSKAAEERTPALEVVTLTGDWTETLDPALGQLSAKLRPPAP